MKISKMGNELLVTLYLTLLFIVISLAGTYTQTMKLYNKFVSKPTDQVTYGEGESFSNKGFILHIIVFAILVFLPMYFTHQQAS